MVRIAVLEDDDFIRDLVQEILTERGYDVVAFSTLTEASEALRAAPPDLLISDVELPDGSGLDLVGSIRDREGNRVPAIVLSSLQKEQDFVRGFAAGAVDYLRKPFTRDELLARCAIHLTRAMATAAAREPRDEDDLPKRLGLVFGRYTIVRELGRGGYGRVFLARDAMRDDATVALKVLAPLGGDAQETRMRFIRETYIASGVVHPRVARLHDVGTGGGRIYYAMEFIAGASLGDHVRRNGVLGEGQVRVLAAGLLDALAAVARAGFVHRDLKPDNVILRDDNPGDPVLIDFGLAKRPFDRSLTVEGMVGTIPYMSPEMIRGQEADQRTDLFSLGLTLRFALSGEEVFPELRGVDLMKAISAGPIPPPLSAITPAFGEILAKLVAVERDDRYESAETALAALRAWKPSPPRSASNEDTRPVSRPESD